MLHEKYRPKTWDAFVGQERLIPRVRKVLARAMQTQEPLFAWLSGPSGTGKTTLARLCAAELGARDVEEINGDKLTADRAREIESYVNLWARWESGTDTGMAWQVWIINEAHAITDRAVQVLLGLLEPRANVRRRAFFFTTTESSDGLFGAFGGPLFSRCVKFPFTNQSLAQSFATRAREIASAENLNGKPIERYVRLAQECKNNFRAMLSAIEGLEMVEA